jgi:HAD superfamily hydrolase (TIGR01490 family)
LNLALFDLDNTLLAGDSDFEWAQFLIEQGVLDREVYEARNLEFYEQYKKGTLDIHAFLDFQLKPLSRHPRRQLDDWHDRYMQVKIMPMMRDSARALVTATNSFVTAPIARAFGIPHLVATEPAQVNGEFTGGVEGLPCFRDGKVARVEAWLAGQGRSFEAFEHSFFYSDSLNDLPLLARVSDPVAVDPDDTLRAHAVRHGWPVVSLN